MVQLVPMTESEFQVYSKRSIENYAQEHIRAGDWHPSEALQKAEKEFMRLCPDGVASKNQHFFSIQDGNTGEKVGMIWFALRIEALRSLAFIYDFLIYEEFRRRGYGKQTFIVLEEKAKELGADKISLHVFGHNKPAIALYQMAGYEITDLQMEKKLSVIP
jgi:ribosomal protein S18 acetylase RimI-like enzyme